MKIKAMSFNLRLRVEADGINYFFNRADKVIKAIRDEDPDIIGFQEASQSMRDLIRRELQDTYTIIGCGRNKDYRGEGACLAYKRDIFELVSFDTFWLSDTPSVPGSRYEALDQSHCPRNTVCAQLSPLGTEETFLFVNTHLDHKGEKARTAGMEQIMAYINERGGKFVLTGDMNATPNTECIAAALSNEGVIDTTAGIGGTFHGYGTCSNCKIDYIFTNGTSDESHIVPDEHKDGIYISDHFVVCSDIEI